MAEIKLQGSTSGEITISAPAVAGTNTLTLPANTGNIITTGDSGTVTQDMIGSGVAGTGSAFGAWATGQSFAHNTWTKLTCSNEVFDTNSNYDNATNYRFTPTVAGYYQINGNLAIPGTSGICVVAIWKNNALAFSGSQANLVSEHIISNVSAVFYMNGSTDYVELYGIQTSGSSQSSLSASSGGYNFFNGALIRAA